MKLPKIGVNFYKVVIGVVFSLLWAKVMYVIWPQPSYITFIWFYLGLGSVLVKWVFFQIIDRIHTKARLKAVEKELARSDTRVQQVTRDAHQRENRGVSVDKTSDAAFETSLPQIQEDVLSLAREVQAALGRSLGSLRRRDIVLARRVIREDVNLDAKEFAIREECMRVMAAGTLGFDELRVAVAILGIITELERMGDYAEGIASITLMIGEGPRLGLPVDVPRMAGKGLQMLRGSMQSFLDTNVEKAKEICRLDDEVDALYDHAFRELLLLMIREPELITQLTRLIWVAHNLERFADRVTNICEWVVFGLTGEKVEIGASKY